jgi:hypothetical protein
MKIKLERANFKSQELFRLKNDLASIAIASLLLKRQLSCLS